MWEIALWFYALMLCLNGVLGYGIPIVEEQFGLNPLSPFDPGTNVTAIDQPNTGNEDNSAGLLRNVTGNVVDSTNTILDPFNNLTNYLTGGAISIINFITGNFIWQTLTAFGLPQTAAILLVQAPYFFFLTLTVIHLIRYGV